MRSLLVMATIAVFATVDGQFLSSYNLIADPSSLQGLQPLTGFETQSLAHPAVVENAAMEARLPANLLNDQYKNPRIAAALAEESWFANKEYPAVDRAAERIPRRQIFKIIKSAGFQRR